MERTLDFTPSEGLTLEVMQSSLPRTEPPIDKEAYWYSTWINEMARRLGNETIGSIIDEARDNATLERTEGYFLEDALEDLLIGQYDFYDKCIARKLYGELLGHLRKHPISSHPGIGDASVDSQGRIHITNIPPCKIPDLEVLTDDRWEK